MFRNSPPSITKNRWSSWRSIRTQSWARPVTTGTIPNSASSLPRPSGTNWQGKGLGTDLFRYIVKIAKENGYAEMTALILDENKNAFNILKKTIPGDLKTSYEGNLIRVTFAL